MLLYSGVLDTSSGVHLRLYLLQAPSFVNPNPEEGETDVRQLGDKEFVARTDPAVMEAYQVCTGKENNAQRSDLG